MLHREEKDRGCSRDARGSAGKHHAGRSKCRWFLQSNFPLLLSPVVIPLYGIRSSTEGGQHSTPSFTISRNRWTILTLTLRLRLIIRRPWLFKSSPPPNGQPTYHPLLVLHPTGLISRYLGSHVGEETAARTNADNVQGVPRTIVGNCTW